MLRAASWNGTSPITLHVYMYVVIFLVTVMGFAPRKSCRRRVCWHLKLAYSRVAGTEEVASGGLLSSGIFTQKRT